MSSSSEVMKLFHKTVMDRLRAKPELAQSMLSATTDPSTPKSAKAKPISMVSPTSETGTARSSQITLCKLKGIPTPTHPEVRSWVKSSLDQRKYRDMHCGDIKVTGIPAIDIAEENRVNELRHRKLVGKTINGTFTKAKRGSHHWIRWNSNKCDNVRIPAELAYELFKGEPQTGARVRCLITGLSPENTTAWRKYPHCETFELNCPNQPGTMSSPWRSTSTAPLAGKLPSLRSDCGSPTWTRRAMPYHDRLNRTDRSTTSFQVGSVSSLNPSAPSYQLPASRTQIQRSVHRQVRRKQYVSQQYLNCDMGSWRSRQTPSYSPRLSASLESLAEVGKPEL